MKIVFQSHPHAGKDDQPLRKKHGDFLGSLLLPGNGALGWILRVAFALDGKAIRGSRGPAVRPFQHVKAFETSAA